TADDSAYISVAEAAKSLDIDLAIIAKLVKAKEIDYFQKDGLLFVNISQLIFKLTDPARQVMQEGHSDQFFESAGQEQSIKKKKQKTRNVQFRSKAKSGKRQIIIKKSQSLLEKLIERVEKLSYEKGYLEGQLALKMSEHTSSSNTNDSIAMSSAESEDAIIPQVESVVIEELAIVTIAENTSRPEGDFAISEYIHGQTASVTDDEQNQPSEGQRDTAEESAVDDTAQVESTDDSEKELVTAKASTQSKVAHNSKRKKRRR
ncbi:MAG: hypothetical protein K2X81_20505, partial [Candidatus Obscuribacterales bacterium]|nr:hypothetical protein [Candidatus Obscuribacterales bacterium]